MDNSFLTIFGSISSIVFLINWILRIVALFVVPRNRPPMSGMAWLLVIYLLPIPGWIIYAMFGSSKLPKNRRNVQSRIDDYLDQVGSDITADSSVIKPKYAGVMKLAETLAHMPLTYCDRYEIIDEYDEVFDRLVEDIDQAREIVTVNFFIMVLDKTSKPVVAALERAAARGVSVYVLYDDYAHYRYRRLFAPLKRRLEAAGVRCEASLPIRVFGRNYMRPDLRNHRKTVTIDHNVGYIGSLNLIEKTYHRKDRVRYKELMVRFEGYVVQHLDIVFATDWRAETKEDILFLQPLPKKIPATNLRVQLVPSGPGYADENNLKVFTALFYAAEKSITVVNPYFVPDPALMTAIVSAAARGVKVTMINSAVSDQLLATHSQRSYYEELFKAGIAVYWYKEPTLVHSKFIVIDEEVGVVGSSNLDMRSFELDSEITIVVHGEQFASGLQAVADNYLASSRLLNAEDWAKRPRLVKLIDNIARLTSSLQ